MIVIFATFKPPPVSPTKSQHKTEHKMSRYEIGDDIGG